MTRGSSHMMRSRSRGLIGLCLAYFLIILDAGVLNLALPTIRHDLSASMAGAQWVLDGYTVALAALLLSSGRAGDRWGHRRVLCGGVIVFVIASAGCALAPDIGGLIAWRAVQGVGAAIVLPATLALIPHLFTEESVRGRATVCWVGAGALAMAAAPLIGGALIAILGWRSIFAVNLPLGALALWLIRTYLPETPRRPDVPVDPWGQVLAVAGLGLVTTEPFSPAPDPMGRWPAVSSRRPSRWADSRGVSIAPAIPLCRAGSSGIRCGVRRSSALGRWGSSSTAHCSGSRSRCRPVAGGRHCTPDSACCP